jgi:fatty-acyl-CoA synthase
MQDNTVAVTPSAHEYQLLLKNILFSPIAYNPDQEIVYGDKLRLNYQQLRDRVKQLANALVNMGIKPGDTVAVMDFDSHRYLECYFAIPMIGAVLHTVNVRLPPEQILYTIEHAEDDVMFIHSEMLPLVEAIKGRLGGIENFVLLSDDGTIPESSVPFTGEYEALLAAEEPEFDFPDFDENTRATTFYTTGTTGLPKGVYFSHRQLVLHTLAATAALGTSHAHGSFHRDDVYMPLTPMFHVHAWGVPYVATFMGVKQVYPGKYVPETLLKLLLTEKVTFSHCVPTIIHMLFSHPKIDTVDLRGWKVVIGGAAMPKALCKRAMELGIDMYSGYGLSETCPILTLAHLPKEKLDESLDDQAALRSMTGRPMGLVEMRIVDEEMKDVPADGKSTGEIVVRTPWLTQGYFKESKDSEQLWQGGYLHTADVACVDEAGFVRITDRTKDVIKVGGEWVSSLELEDVIGRHPAVNEVAVIASPDEKWGERPLALIVLHEDSPADEKAILNQAKALIDKGIMAREGLLVRIQFVDSLDKTSVGKTDKKALRKKYA